MPKSTREKTIIPSEVIEEPSSDGGQDIFSIVVDLLVAQTEAMTKTNLRLDQIDTRLAGIEKVTDKLDLTREIGNQISAAVNTQETKRNSLVEKQIKADVAVAKAEAVASTAKFTSLAKVAEKLGDIATSKTFDNVMKILIFSMLGLNLLPPGCRVGLTQVIPLLKSAP
jgi:DNA-binding FrmR family transcriptional regulator